MYRGRGNKHKGSQCVLTEAINNCCNRRGNGRCNDAEDSPVHSPNEKLYLYWNTYKMQNVNKCE